MSQRLSILVATICLSACVSVDVLRRSQADKPQSSYRNLSIQESQFSENSGTPATLLLAERTPIDGNVWTGTKGTIIALRSGRPTLFQGRQTNGFFAYALFDPVDEWRVSLETAPTELVAGALTIRYLWHNNLSSAPIIEHRIVRSVTESYGELCDSFATGPCWVIDEEVWFGNPITKRTSTTVIDAISHQVVSITYPLPDGYSHIAWQRVR